MLVTRPAPAGLVDCRRMRKPPLFIASSVNKLPGIGREPLYTVNFSLSLVQILYKMGAAFECSGKDFIRGYC